MRDWVFADVTATLPLRRRTKVWQQDVQQRRIKFENVRSHHLGAGSLDAHRNDSDLRADGHHHACPNG
jgi:hypothetical protein